MTDEETQLLATMLPDRYMTLTDVLTRAKKKDRDLTKGLVQHRLSKLVERGAVQKAFHGDKTSFYKRVTSCP